jgi:hypothetical protein
LHDKPPGEDDPELAAWDMLAEMTREAEKNLDHLFSAWGIEFLWPYRSSNLPGSAGLGRQTD